MLLWLFFLFTAVPAFELWLLFQIADAIGGLETIYLIVLTGIVGSAMAKRQGAATWKKIQLAMAEGRSPGIEMTEGLLILLGGVLLVTPGAMTDVFGLLTLLPPTRKLMAIGLQAQMKKRMRFQGQVHGFNAHFGQDAFREHDAFGTHRSSIGGQASDSKQETEQSKRPTKGWSHPEVD